MGQELGRMPVGLEGGYLELILGRLREKNRPRVSKATVDVMDEWRILLAQSVCRDNFVWYHTGPVELSKCLISVSVRDVVLRECWILGRALCALQEEGTHQLEGKGAS